MWFKVTVVVVLLVTAGCIAVPYRVSESSETFIEEESFEFIEIGQSTRAEMQQAIGLPDWSFNDGSRWIYKVRMLKPGGWGGCYIEVISAEGSAGCGRSDDQPVMTILDLSISNLDVISTQEISTVKMGACTQTGVCFGAWESPVTLLASPEEEAHVKQFQAEPEQCAVFLYTDSPFSNRLLIVDSVRVLQEGRGSGEFLRLSLDPGEHRILVAHDSKMTMEDYGIIDIDCLAGGVHFLLEQWKRQRRRYVRENGTIRMTSDYASRLALVPDDEGRSAVMDKTLRLLPDSALLPPNK